MKTNKSSLAGFILFTLLASGSFLTCEIGLGNSVDTKPPTVSVSYPPSFSIIRGDFVVSGKASDETALSRVLVSLTGKSGADSGKKFGPWSATIDPATKAWQVTVPQPAADGDYDVEAVAVDSAGRKTSAAISYKIDNTPPVLVVQRPSTKGVLADVDLFDAFGSDLSFNGNYWDRNGAGTMSVWFYGDNGLPVSATPYTYVPPTQSWAFKISEATDASGTWDALNALVPTGGIGTFWYVIALEDNALTYTDPTENDAELTAGKTGNRTSHYYNYLDISAELGVGESYPKFNELSAFDAGDSAALDAYGYDTLVAALPALRISSDIASFDFAVNGNFSFEPTSKNPTIEIDSIPISSATPHATDNTVSPLPNPLILISRNKDGDDLDMDSIVIELTPFQADGETLDAANRETWSGTALTDHASIKTIGADQVAVNFLIEKSEGEYELSVTVSDKVPHTITKKYGFRINKGAPSLISISPDKSTSVAGSVTKINSVAGKFQVVIKGSDDDTDVTLAVTEGGAVPADAAIVRDKETTGYLTNYEWTVTLDAPAEGDTRTLRFQLNDGLYTSSVRELAYLTDDTPPTLISLATPTLKTTGHVAEGKAVVIDSMVTVRGFASEDLEKAILYFTTSAVAPGTASTAGWTEAEADNSLTHDDVLDIDTRGFSASVPLNALATAAEGQYWLWARFADDTFDETLENYGAVEAVCQVIYDKNDPALTETTLGTVARQYRTGAYTLDGTVSDTDAIHSLAVSWTLNNGTETTETVTPVGTAWTYSNAAPSQGVYRYTFVVTDIAGNTETLTREIQVDAIDPVVSISGGPSITITTSEYTFRGTVTEADSGVASIEVSMDNGITWDAPEGTTVWYYTYDFGSTTEGPTRQLLARAADNAGNVSAGASVDYTIDLADPRATLASSVAPATAANADVTFTGVADDAAVTPGRAAATATLTYSKDGGSAITVPAGTDPDEFNLTAGNWTWTLPTSLGDGLYNMTLTVVDPAGKTKIATGAMKIDTTAPTLGITAPQAGQQEDSATFAISGISDDGAGVKFDATNDVEYCFDNASWTAFAGAEWTGYNWGTTVTLVDIEGAKTLYVRSTDALGNQSSSSVAFYYDKDAPTLDVTGTGSVGSEQVLQNGNFSLDLAADDTNALKSLTLTATRDGVLQGTLYSQSWTAVSDTKTFSDSYAVAAAGHALEGLWVYTVTAIDQADRATVVTRTVLIDTVAPTAAITAFPVNYYADGTLSVNGTASDASAYATSGLSSVEYSIDGESTWHALNGTATWYKTDINASALAEGTNTVYVRATDVAGNVTAVSASRTFLTDHADPLLAESAVNTTDVTNSRVDVILGGTASDTNSIDPATGLTVSVNGGATTDIAIDTDGADNVPGNGDDDTWSYTFDADARSEGTYVLLFTATDAANRHASVTRTVALDKTVPTISLSTDLSAWQRLVDVTIGGTAGDAGGTVHSGVATVQYSLDNATWVNLSGTTTWVGTIAFPESASNTLYLRSIDAAGNVSVVSGPHTVRVDATNPLFAETVANNTAETNADLTYSGTISDNLALDGANPLTLIRKKNGVTVAPNIDIVPAAGNWTYTQTAAGNDGNWEFSFVARDDSGLTTPITKSFTIDTTAPTLNVTVPAVSQAVDNATLSISGTASDGAGVGFDATDDVQYSFDNATWTTFVGAEWDGYNWVKSVTVPGVEGAKTLYVRSYDSLANLSSRTVAFYYDQAAPVLGETTVNTSDTQFRSTDLVFGGTASDTNFIDPATGLTVSVNGGATTDIAIDTDGADNVPGNGDDDTWSYTFDADAPANDTYTLVFTATDAANRTTTVTRTVLLDKTVPTVSVTTDLSAWTTGNIVIGGACADTGGSSLSLVEYQLGGTGGAWTPASLSGATWTGNLSLSGSPEGSISLYVRATDRAGNASSVGSATATVLVDHSAPVLTETAVNTTATQYRASDLAFGGVASDTNYLDPASGLTVSINGGATTDIAIDADGANNVPGDGDDNAWSYTFDADAAADDTYTLLFTATDAAGKTASVTRTVLVDKTAPVVTMAAVGGYQSGAVSISGTITETNLSSVQYQLDGTGGAWTLASVSGGAWSGSLDFSAATEGSHTVYYRATDLAGTLSNGGTAQTVTVNVDRANPNASIAAGATARGLTDAGLELRETDFTLSGVCNDAAITGGRLPSTAILTATRDGASLGALTLTTGGAGTGTWTYEQAVNEATHADDGLYVYTMTVTDAAGKVATGTLTVRIDTTAPTVVIDAPASGESSNASTYDISGTSRDTGGVGFASSTYTDAEYSLDSTDGSDGTWTTLGSLDATINWSAAGVSLGAQGAKSMYVRSTDRIGNGAFTHVDFYYDESVPTLGETAVNTTDTQYRSSDLVFGGTASDTNYLNPASGLTVRVNGGGTTNIAIDTDGADNTAGNGDDNTWSYTFDADAPANGTYNLVFTATDAANRTTTVARTVVIDKTAPTITLATINGGASGTFADWKGTFTVAVTGTAADANTNINLVEYSTDAGSTWGSLSGTTAWSGTIPVVNGANELRIRSRDLAGNYSAETVQTVNIDLETPVVSVTTPASLVRVNGLSDLATAFSVTDVAGSGISSVLLRIGSTNFGTPDATATLSAGDAYNGTWAATLSAATLLALTDGQQYTVYVRAFDGVNNATTASFQIMVDESAPTAAFTSPSSGATVNRLIDISGTGGDTQALASVVVSIEHSDLTTWTPLETFNASAGYNWTLSNFDTDTYGVAGYDTNGAGGTIQITLRAVATDEAGNTFTATRSLIVDQDSDRPIVKLSNVNVDGSTTLKLINTVFGTVSDDDGVTLFEISEDGTTWLNATANPTRVTIDGNTWSYVASGGDGQKTLYFRVTDAATTVFTTDLANEPKVQYGLTVVSAPINFRIDTFTPEVGSDIFVDRLAPFAYEADAYTDVLINNMPFGGTAQQFAVGITATDANGIASVSVSVPGAAATPYTATGTFTNAPVINALDIKNGGMYEIASVSTTDFTTFGAAANTVGTQFTANRDGTGGDTGTVRAMLYTTGSIDVAAASDGYVQLTITVTDTSGLTATATRTILIDNSAPSATHQTPIANSTVNGDIEVKGLADDGFGSGVKSVRYQVGIASDLDPDSASWLAVTAGTLSWSIDFEGVDKIDTFANATYGTAGVGADAGLWLVPIVLRVEDNAGNVSVTDTSNYVLKVDPSGDRPKVTVVYPDPLETNRVMGGIIRIFGSSEDDDGVESVWMQVDVNNDGVYDASDVASNGTDWFNGGDGQLASGTISWNRSINTAGEFNPSATDVNATAIRNGSIYKIVTVGTTDYTDFGATDNNVGTEFRASRAGTAGDGTGTATELIRRINFQVRGRDINTTPVDGTWVGPYVIDIDQNVPKIGSTTPLTITQGGTVQTYQADMWVNGNWVLSGSVEDESGIASISIDGDITGTIVSQPTWFVAGPDIGGGHYNYSLNVPITTLAGSTDSVEFTITALDNNTPQLSSSTTVRINYDNENPTVTTLQNTGADITVGNPVVQSNNTYTIESSVTESGSGFQRVAYYFERNVANDALDRVYNPMETKTADANRTYLNTLTMVDGLPRLHITSGSAGFSRTDEYTLYADALIGNYNVRKGGIVKIGGIDRLITFVDYAAGYIQWADAVDTGVTTADIAYALVVDNLKVESPVWSGSTLVSITNDDGDGVIESVERSGGLYSWSSSFDSRNIPDGPIEIHWVAYDKAGNYTTGSVTSSVQNNRPLLASVTLGTDLDGNGSVSAGERVPAYSALDGSSNEQAVATVLSSAFVAKGLTSVDIDVVGGNGATYYTFESDNAGTVTGIWTLSAFASPAAIETTGDTLTLASHGFANGRPVYVSATVMPDETAVGTLTAGMYFVRDAAADTFSLAKTSGGAAIDFATTGTDVTIGNTVYIPETTLTSGSIGEGTRSFIFTIWDSTEETTPGTDSQWCELTVPLVVDAVDGVSPRSVISPFYWTGTGADENSLYGDSRDNGHIELEADLPAGTFNQANGVYDLDPKVSGQISIRGTIYDDQRLSSLWAFIGSGNTSEFAFTNAATTSNQFDTNADGTLETLGRTYTRLATFNSTTGLWEPVAASVATEGWSLTLTQDYLNQDGHAVHWKLDWDSSFIDNVAATDRQIRIIAVDRRPNASSETATPTGSITTNNVPEYQIDVVPYITRIVTRLSALKTTNPSVFDRTALGHYPVNAADSIALHGFNLTGSDVTGITGESDSGGAVTVPMAAATSGNLALTVNGVDLLNNDNSESEDYNLLPNGDNNDLLTDDVVLDVWAFNNRAAVPISGRIVDPVMKINPSNGLIGFAFTNGPLYFSMGGYADPDGGGAAVAGDYSYIYWQASYDFMCSIAFAYDSTGASYGSAAGGDINAGSADKFSFMTSRWGRSGLTQTGSYGGTNALRMESIGQDNGGVIDFNKYRILSPQYATSRHGATTNIYLAYFDDLNAEIRFRYGNLADTATTKTAFVNFVDSDTAGYPPAYNTTNKSMVAGSLTGRNPGEYVSIGVVPGATQTTDVVTIVWYDATLHRLLYSYNTTPATNRSGVTDGTGWSAPQTIFTDAGEYCQLAVDAAGGIHIAAYDINNADLLYAYLETYDDATPETCTVDSYGIVGSNITLDTAMVGGRAVPYIGYYAQSSVRPKYAYLVDTVNRAPAGVLNDKYTGDWEVTLLPSASSIPQDRINVGVWKDSATGVLENSVIGTSSYTKTGTGYTSVNYGRCYGNGTSNGVLAYQIKESTNGYIETAQKQ